MLFRSHRNEPDRDGGVASERGDDGCEDLRAVLAGDDADRSGRRPASEGDGGPLGAIPVGWSAVDPGEEPGAGPPPAWWASTECPLDFGEEGAGEAHAVLVLGESVLGGHVGGGSPGGGGVLL